MTEPGAEFYHFARRVFARAIPAHERADGKTVTQIVDARPAPVSVIFLRRTQSDILADDGEVVPGAAIGQTISAITCKEGLRPSAEKR